MINFTLKIGTAAPVSFSELGVTDCFVSHATWAKEVSTITTNEPIDSPDLIPPFVQCEIADLDGHVRFVGVMLMAPRRATPQSERKTYELHGLAIMLERITYRDPDQLIGALMGFRFQYPATHDEIIGQLNALFHRTIREELVKVCTVIRSKGISILDPPPGALEIPMPWRSLTNSTFYNALQVILQFAPSWALVSDGATLKFIDTLTAPAHPVTGLMADLSDVSLTPRYDLLREQVRLRYSRIVNGHDKRIVSSSNDNSTTVVHTDIVTTTTVIPAAIGVEEIDIQLNEFEPWFPPGLAEELARMATKLQIDTQITAKALHWEVKAGHRLTLDGMLSQWSTHDTVIQTITRDLFREETIIVTGTRKHIGLESPSFSVHPAALPSAPPSEPGPVVRLREIERCDGKKAMVQMSEWYD